MNDNILLSILEKNENFERFTKVSNMLPDIKVIFDKLQDEESRIIFTQLLLFYLEMDYEHIVCMLDKINAFEEAVMAIEKDEKNLKCQHISKLFEAIEKNPEKQVIYYNLKGTQEFKGLIDGFMKYKNIDICLLCEDNPELEGSERNGYHVVSPATLAKNHNDAYAVIGFSMYYKEIYGTLIAIGFEHEQIFWQPYYPYSHLLNIGDELYFGPDFLKPVSNEIYVDAGCYDGDTILKFIEFCDGNYKKIYGLEPDPANLKKTLECVKENKLHDVEITPKGAWSEECDLTFANNSNMDSKICKTEEGIKIATTTIDNIVGDDAVTFIKMDIEGAELEALKGAKNTIIKNKPRLAISIYHNPIDILEIPTYINTIAPHYIYFIRHHTSIDKDTILYALPTQ